MRALIALLIALAFPLCQPAAATEGLVTKASKYSVKDTLDRLTAALKDQGIVPVARVNHAAAAKAAGLDLKPTEVLLFGNPKLGTPLMQENRHIAIDLPMRVLAWEDDAGKVFVAYTRPDSLKARYNIKGQDGAWKAMAGALEAFTSAATK